MKPYYKRFEMTEIGADILAALRRQEAALLAGLETVRQSTEPSVSPRLIIWRRRRRRVWNRRSANLIKNQGVTGALVLESKKSRFVTCRGRRRMRLGSSTRNVHNSFGGDAKMTLT